ncbi:S8 family serine peptidase [Nioella aestuarii]|uniref:S8 family serine peptidase n=1 Tax=Nioella aestuarii TaxID=1662864 RepID=UPI003D7F4218
MFRSFFFFATAFVLALQVTIAGAQTEPTDPTDPGTGGPTSPGQCDGPCDDYYPYHSNEEDGEGIAGRDGSGHPRAVVSPSGMPEYIVSGPISEFEASRVGLTDAGAQLLRYRDLPTLGIRIAVYDFRWRFGVRRANSILDQVAPNTHVGLHHIYELSQARPRVYAATMIGDAAPGACPVGRHAIGLIDGPVDPEHPALAGAQVVSRSFLSDGEVPPAINHGTAVAALIVGQDPSGALGGFAPGATLYAVSAFTEARGDAGADIERIATSIEWLLQQDVRLINMSFAGPDNPVLSGVLDSAAARGAIMIAAAGNDGRERLAFPAGHPSVIAVTAVDAAFRRYRDANFGDHIEFAAPGVDLYVASSRGGNYASGTSYAAPIVTALAARLGAGSGASLTQIRERLRGSAVDLGPDGFDSRFGWGLVRGGC